MRRRKVAVIGMGKIGLPLASAIGASQMYQVAGLDTHAETVSKINQGISPVYGEPELDSLLETLVAAGRLTATTSYSEAISDAEVVIIATPLYTNSNNEPDFSMLDVVVDGLAQHLKIGTLVILETTVPIGTTRERIWNKLLEKRDFLDSDIFVAFSPERISTGSFFKDLSNYPKVVGGVNKASTQEAANFYKSFIRFSSHAWNKFGERVITTMDSCESAEFVKLAETSYRDLNIALANQFQDHATSLGLSFSQIREAANSQPYSHLHSPGIWVGGHCIPVYPHFYLWTDPDASLLALGRSVNKKRPRELANLFAKDFAHLKDSEIVILGLAYRGGVKESAFSGTFELVKELENNGFLKVTVFDPLFSNEEVRQLGLMPIQSKSSPKGVILHTDHQTFRTFAKDDFPSIEVIIDGRGILDPANFPGVEFISLLT